MNSIAKNIELIKKNIEKLCSLEKVKIIAVSKTFSSDKIKEAFNCGLDNFGENYVQEMVKKQEELKDLNIKWHFIGHLQKNKVKYIVGRIEYLHSLDSIKLAEILNKRYENQNKKLKCLIQINIGKESTKSGIFPEQIDEFFEKIVNFRNLLIKGFMCIPPFSIYKEESRKYFREMKKIFDKYQNLKTESIDICELSMGMSKDYEIAIEEGATMVRIGTLIFGERGK